MQIFRTDDKQVSKFIHTDGSETCIKTVYSVDYKPNGAGDVDVKVTDRNKYSVFISASKGCAMACTFCYLTIDDVPFGKLRYDEVIQNIKEAILNEAGVTNLGSRFIKICWMGMGEAILTPDLIRKGTLELLEWVMDNGLALGLDGVDVSTVLPKVKDGWVEQFAKLENELGDYNLNPNNKNVVNQESGTLVKYANRSRFRLFYSLHSAIQENREKIIPNAMPIKDACARLLEVADAGVNVIIHHMFLEGTNDSAEELDALIGFMNLMFPDNELRVLRYNKHDDSDIRETENFEAAACYIQGSINKVKVQVSYGKDVKSACGQFVYNHTAELEKFKV
jgi:adenine C2-methylase RlmN of 23S rRNA A2503 and tRNA A37